MDSDFPLTDEHDHDILMHKDAHFGGSFDLMLDYYAKDGKGALPEFELERIQELADYEKTQKENLSELILLEYEKARVKSALQMYQNLKNLYNTKDTITHLIADLVFSEEEDPTVEINAIVSQKEKATLPLIELLKSDDLYDPLFPGYGMAPALAARCLGLIQDQRAIIPLFQAMGKEDFFTEEAICDALYLLGENAKHFLINALKRKPLTKENTHAVIVLLHFKEDETVANVCLELLQDAKVLLDPTFSAYLILGCSGLKGASQEEFITLLQSPTLSSDLKEEMAHIIKNWKK